MTRGTRFGCWVAVAAVAVLAPIATVASSAIAPVAAWTAGAALAAMAALLATTPPAAIVLRRPASRWILASGAGLCAALWAWAVAPTPRTAAFGALAGVAAAGLVVWRLGREGRGRRAGSPWWIAPVLWHPLVGLLGVAAAGLAPEALTLAVLLAALAVCVGWLRSGAMGGRRPGPGPWLAAMLMLALAAAASGWIAGGWADASRAIGVP